MEDTSSYRCTLGNIFIEMIGLKLFINNEVVNRLEKPSKIEKQPIFD